MGGAVLTIIPNPAGGAEGDDVTAPKPTGGAGGIRIPGGFGAGLSTEANEPNPGGGKVGSVGISSSFREGALDLNALERPANTGLNESNT